MKLRLRTLSPLHIGTGNELQPFDYERTPNDKLIILNHEAIINKILDIHGEKGINEYLRWMDKYVEDIENLDRQKRQKKGNERRDINRQLSDLRHRFKVSNFCREILKDRNLTNRILTDKNFHRYSAELLDSISREKNLREIIKSNHEPYIPGSSIKGAVRTALASLVIMNLNEKEANEFLHGIENSDFNGILSVINAMKKQIDDTKDHIYDRDISSCKHAFKVLNDLQRKLSKEIGESVEKYVFNAGTVSKKTGKKIYKDGKYDLMRFVKISDALPSKYSLEVGELCSYTNTFNRRQRRMMLAKQPVGLIEYVTKDSEFIFELSFDRNFHEIPHNLETDKNWIDLNQKYRRLFGFSHGESIDNPDNVLYRRLIESFKNIMPRRLEAENRWLNMMDSRELNSIENYYSQFRDNFPLIRIGFSSGWLSTTIGLAMWANPFLKDMVKDIIFIFGLDLIINQKRLLKSPQRSDRDKRTQERLLSRQVDFLRFPKSRRMLANKYGKPIRVMGWCVMEEL